MTQHPSRHLLPDSVFSANLQVVFSNGNGQDAIAPVNRAFNPFGYAI
nr:hypothetical protein [Polynucleobacter sp. es-GGE-1]